jgi:hypothetical protein
VEYTLRLTQNQHEMLRGHLFPGDGHEAVALALCGRRSGRARHVFTVHRIIPVPYAACQHRSPERVTWSTDLLDTLLPDARRQRFAILKIHSHPGGYEAFSECDDISDQTMFESISSWLGDERPHASAVMLPDGRMFGRAMGDGALLAALSPILVVGDDLQIWNLPAMDGLREAFTLRHAQFFGAGTTGLLRRLAIGVVGCSGTGSPVVEQLARLGAGRLVLVDPDLVEDKNLNRILNTRKEDADRGRAKVDVLADAIGRMGFGQEVVPLAVNLASPEALQAISQCDVVFGCMDGAEGRHLLNRLATFYTLPYIDLGVRLDADGQGGIAQIAGAVHYLQPGRTTLLDRGVYTMAQVEAEEMRRTNPEIYREQARVGYLRGVDEDRPAVISVNMFFAALAVNEFLARIHPYRNDSNEAFATLRASLADVQFYREGEGEASGVLSRYVGRGDTVPLLERPMPS